MAIRMGSRKVAPGHVQTAIARPSLYRPCARQDDTASWRTLQQILKSGDGNRDLRQYSRRALEQAHLHLQAITVRSPTLRSVTSCADEASRHNLTEFFGEVVAVGNAVGARFIPSRNTIRRIFIRASLSKSGSPRSMPFAKSWKLDDRKGPLRQIQKSIKTEVDFTLAYVVREGEKFKISTPLCRKVLDMIHELETGKRKLGLESYAELRASS